MYPMQHALVLMSIFMDTVWAAPFNDSIAPLGPNTDQLTTQDLGPTREKSPIRVACIGDSITWGYRGFAPASLEAYPSVLQRLLGDGYTVTNLGNPGKTVQRDGQDHGNTSASYWETAEFERLRSSSWDIVVIQLGTNDAKDTSNGGPPNWKHDLCDISHFDRSCPYAADLSSLIDFVRTLGSPDIFINVPPPVTQAGAFQINATVVNSILPLMIPSIAEAKGIARDHIANMFAALGGPSVMIIPSSGCDANISSISGCAFFCDGDFCDQVHPADAGFRAMAAVLANAITMANQGVLPKFSVGRPSSLLTPFLLIAAIALAVLAAGLAYCIWTRSIPSSASSLQLVADSAPHASRADEKV